MLLKVDQWESLFKEMLLLTINSKANCEFSSTPHFKIVLAYSFPHSTPFKHLICWKSLYVVDGVFLHSESSKWRYSKLSKIPLIPDTLETQWKEHLKKMKDCLNVSIFLYIVTSFSIQLAFHLSLGSAFQVASFITLRKYLSDVIGMA